MPQATGVQDVIPDLGLNVDIDFNVRKALPPGSQIKNAVTYSTAAWTRAARVIVELEDGSETVYFLKCASGYVGKRMLEGEFAALVEIAKYNPALTPIPYAYGQFRDASYPTYFLLMEFLEIDTGAPKPKNFCKQLANLHASSVSPTRKFGFHILTCQGINPQDNTWEDSWSVFFARLLRQFFERDGEANGPSSDGKFELEMEKLITQTVPKILGPLQADGRTLKPSLVHGNLWEENCGTELETGQPKIFDAAAFYGHNELEIGMWRREVVHFGRAHIREYLRNMPPSDPKDQWDDRNRLYSVKFDLSHSIALPATYEGQREMIFKNAHYLNDKYNTKDMKDAKDAF